MNFYPAINRKELVMHKATWKGYFILSGKKIRYVGLHVYEVLEQTKLVYGDENQGSKCLVKRTDWIEMKRNFLE